MTTTLGKYATIGSGYPFRGRIEPSREGNALVVQIRNIDENDEILDNGLTLTELPGKKSPDWLLANDILFIAKGTKNTATLVKKLPKNTVCSPHFFRLRVKPEYETDVLAEFICWQLNQEPAQRYFKVSAEGSLQVSIRKKVLEETPFVLPDLETQQKIVNLHRCAKKEIKAHYQLIKNRQLEMTAIASVLLNRLDKNT